MNNSLEEQAIRNRNGALSGSRISNRVNAVPTTPVVTPAAAVERLKPYETVKQEAIFLENHRSASKLDWNESTAAPPEEIIDELINELKAGKGQWYPDVNSYELIKELARYTGLDEAYIQTFPGSDSALEYVCRTFLNPGEEVLIAGPTYDNFRIYAESCGARTHLHLGESPWHTDTQGIIDSISANTKIIYIVSPNNPTGVLFTEREIRAILEAAPHALLALDEAYYEFCGVTMAPLVSRYPNLLISRSFSKAFGLAAFRCGYVLSDPRNIGYLNRIRVGKNVSMPAQVCATAALRCFDRIQKYVEQVKENRILLTRKLQALGIPTQPTPANFIMVKVENPGKVSAFLRNRRIYVRDRSRMPQLEGYLRITVGDDISARRVIEAFEAMPVELYRISDDSRMRTTRAVERNGSPRRIVLKRKAETQAGTTRISVDSLSGAAHEDRMNKNEMAREGQ